MRVPARNLKVLTSKALRPKRTHLPGQPRPRRHSCRSPPCTVFWQQLPRKDIPAASVAEFHRASRPGLRLLTCQHEGLLVGKLNLFKISQDAFACRFALPGNVARALRALACNGCHRHLAADDWLKQQVLILTPVFVRTTTSPGAGCSAGQGQDVGRSWKL